MFIKNLFDNLNSREKTAFLLIAEHGATQREIAEAIKTTYTTATNVVNALLIKFGVDNRTQLAILAWREGLVREQDEITRGEGTA